MQVVVNGLLTTYQKSGKGQALVLLHGWGKNAAESFDALTEKLEHTHTVLRLDLPGFGGTQPPAEAWGLSDYAGFISAWLIKIDSKKTKAIIGHSNGGAIAIKGIATGSLKADELILLATAGVRDKMKARKSLLKATAKSGKVVTSALPTHTKKKLRSFFYKSINSDITVMPELEETFKLLVNEDIQGAASKLKLPTLLIYGGSDKDTPPDYGRLLSEAIPDSNLVIIPGAGHFIHQEQPEKVASLIESFLGGEKNNG